MSFCGGGGGVFGWGRVCERMVVDFITYAYIYHKGLRYETRNFFCALSSEEIGLLQHEKSQSPWLLISFFFQ